ncbi:sucrose phosphorylase [Hydrogenispora ethanolica]|uniref:Sucrose phosphorylase n=1 Tax=Hydrogenispora ethanolica TaxID=1082276 RepID=A0A4R1QZC2_HYDET|nr:sugar phosphorylase [Hydrogenispora ethanolica]TCL58343.1 sucrose phosphorylase [Hydrogenispora ethanolica]
MRQIDEQTVRAGLRAKLERLYGAAAAAACEKELNRLIDRYRAAIAQGGCARRTRAGIDQRDVVLIAYADSICGGPDRSPLQTMGDFIAAYLREAITALHLLPFYPYSSDDGFSVIDYRAVDPALGDWEDLRALGEELRLMFDFVANHISARSRWVEGYLNGDPEYADFFIAADPGTDLAAVFRPRALPLLTPFPKADGSTVHLWTTFSADQIDLNYANWKVLLKMTGVLLEYVRNGASLIRLDAIGFLWKRIGSSCMGLPETHGVIQLWRDVLDLVLPAALLITETNVPHRENIRYFGDGANEAQLVYNFPLPPLLLHTFYSGSARRLTRWAAGLETPPGETTFFNFLASHDGIGVLPASGILEPDELERMIATVTARGGRVSYKNNPDGTTRPYELNIVYYDALADPQAGEALNIARFLCAHAIMLALRGLPAIYIHSLLGSRNDQAGVEQTGRARSINREKLRLAEVERDLAAPDSLRRRVLEGFKELIRLRGSRAAFHPLGEQIVLEAGAAVFALLRRSPDGSQAVLALHNVSDAEQPVTVDLGAAGPDACGKAVDPRDGTGYPVNGRVLAIRLEPYQVRWLDLLP